MNESIYRLLESPEPWTRYRTMVDLLDSPSQDREVKLAREEMLTHPDVTTLIEATTTWPGYALTRHNDARHPLYKLSTLADFGVNINDPGVIEIVSKVMAHQSEQGAFLTLVNYPTAFGGSGKDEWLWAACDSPTLLYSLLAMGMRNEGQILLAVEHLLDQNTDIGWSCTVSPELGKFKGPGKRGEPCPIANVYALKALACVPEMMENPEVLRGIEVLLNHWNERGKRRYFLFGIGRDFNRLKYPFIWYDILHVADVLSRFPSARSDPRFKEMVSVLLGNIDSQGCCTAGSMYRAWKGWSFADKKTPSPWMTFLVLRIKQRMSL